MVQDQRNWLERLTEKIPGYSGYVQKERRRDIDKLHREHLADRLRVVKSPVTDLMREMTSDGRLFEVGAVDRLLKKLDKLENRVRFASYGYSGFFDVVKIQEAQLDAIYQFDLALADRVEQLEAKAGALKGQSGAEQKSTIGEMETLADEFDRAFDQRYQAINSYGSEAGGAGEAQGKPLFGV